MENNLYLSPDNVTQLMHGLSQHVPGYQMNPTILVNYMQQLIQQFPNQYNLDVRQYVENLNQYTLRSLIQNIQGQYQQNNGNAVPDMSSMSPDAQALSGLVDQLKRERNYSAMPSQAVPPQLNFMEPPANPVDLLEQVKQKVQQEHQFNQNQTIRSVNLNEVIGSTAPVSNNWSIGRNMAVQSPQGSLASQDPQPANTEGNNLINLSNSPNLPTFNGNANTDPFSMPLKPGLTMGHERLLSLDFRTDVSEIHNNQYTLRFPLIKDVIGLELVAVSLQRQKRLDQQPYLYLSMETNAISLNARCRTGAQQKDFFGKLIPENETFNHYIKYQSEQGAVNFQNPIDIYEMTLAFLDYQFQNLDLKKIQVLHLIRMERNQLKIITEGPHYLNTDDYLLLTQKKEDSWVASQSKIIETPDPTTLITHCQSPVLHHLNIYRVQVRGHLTLRLKTL